MAPTNNTASMIMIEAYKKWVLVGLLLRGEVSGHTVTLSGRDRTLTMKTFQPLSMPRTTNSQAAKAYRAIARPYDAIADIFRSGDGQRLRAEFDFGRQIWRDDCNDGLLCQVLDAFRRFSILKLQSTYLALSIPEIGVRTSPDHADHAETEAYIVSLISTGYLNATLSQSDDGSKPSILRFATTSTKDPQLQPEAAQYADLVKQTEKTVELAGHVRSTNTKLCLSKEYIEWSKKAKKTREAGKGSATDGTLVEMAGDDYGEDEDMMADL
ncbi:MAG: hypothetical protein M1830_010493 [Pleopsidium flavum]|nr:MAG: hypothetical protein M1830_010493 [Pleopsidium flavum]